MFKEGDIVVSTGLAPHMSAYSMEREGQAIGTHLRITNIDVEGDMIDCVPAKNYEPNDHMWLYYHAHQLSYIYVDEESILKDYSID